MNTVEAIALLSSSSDDFTSIMTGGGEAASSAAAADNNNNNKAAGEVDETLPRRFTDHTYHDFSNYIKEGGKLKKHKKSESNFPARLHAMLSDEQYSHIITWMVSFRELILTFLDCLQDYVLTILHPCSGLPLLFLTPHPVSDLKPHGRAWKIIDRKMLETIVIPKYFGKTKYSSFIRQLSGWGFKRLHRSGPGKSSLFYATHYNSSRTSTKYLSISLCSSC